jgi:hypothetical protein
MIAAALTTEIILNALSIVTSLGVPCVPAFDDMICGEFFRLSKAVNCKVMFIVIFTVPSITTYHGMPSVVIS